MELKQVGVRKGVHNINYRDPWREESDILPIQITLPLLTYYTDPKHGTWIIKPVSLPGSIWNSPFLACGLPDLP